MKFSFFIIAIVAYLGLLVTPNIINPVLYNIIYYSSITVLIIWFIIAIKRDITGYDPSLQIHLTRINNSVMGYHLTNRSTKVISVKNLYVTDVFRSKLYDIEGLGLGQELLNIPISFSCLARGASLNSQFEDKKDAFYFFVELHDGRKFSKIINSLI